ncbi:hypothetical protein [Xenorhabdus indica]|uniref:hypothetical protein n=1 Tax=Xenorhabdus indica TaxID=333964 RepID=UPI001656F8A4|nr:hypothetical protein [Xenorhabdus indica]
MTGAPDNSAPDKCQQSEASVYLVMMEDENEKVAAWLECFTSQQIPIGSYARYP